MNQDGGGPGAGKPVSRPRRWLAGRTLRARLIAGLVALLALACAAIGVATYVALQGFMLNSMDKQLSAANRRYVGCVLRPPPEGDSSDVGGRRLPKPNPAKSCAEFQGGETLSVQVGGGKVSNAYLADGESPPLTSADKAALRSLPATGDTGVSVHLSDLGEYRLVASAPHAGVVYITGQSLDPVDATLRKIEITQVIVFSAALVLTGIIGTVWVRLSLRPLRRVTATASRVAELPLASGEVTLPERVPDADPRTEVGQVGAALNRMLGHVESALARRAASEARLRRFAADASHELRTPLAAIRGYAELARRHPGPVPGEVAHALSRVESESARMSVLVDELLLLAQLDAGRPLAREPVDLTRLAIDATSDARVAAPDHRWQLELPDEPIGVRGDEHRLRQVLANLLSNAARHTPSGTTVTVALAEPGDDSGNVVLSVTDNGPGIPADLQPGLFERFVRGDTSRSHATGSTGLGLAIVDAVTAAHGGSVGVSSRPGWTRFVITLPGMQEPLSTRPAPPPQPGAAQDGSTAEQPDPVQVDKHPG